MGNNRVTPYGAFNFSISFGGADFGGFSDASGLVTEFTMAEYREGTALKNHVQKIPGIYKSGDVTLKRGIIDSVQIWEWVEQVRKNGPSGRKDVVIRLKDETNEKVVRSWKLVNATPMKLTGPTLAAKGGGDVAMEELVLSSEDILMGIPEVS